MRTANKKGQCLEGGLKEEEDDQRSKKPSQSFMPSGTTPHARKLNDSLYELYKPPGLPSMDVIFFHGLQSGDDTDPHLSTWKSGDGSCIWPQTWLVENFPGARVFSVSYSARVKKECQGEFDMYNIGENLLSDILQENIGQAPNCPVILVGHCFGGLVIKELCNQAYETCNLESDRTKVKLAQLLANIRGIFYYGTPHHGSPLLKTKKDLSRSVLLEYFKVLSTKRARLNSRFDKLCGRNPKWRIYGLGESLSTKSGYFQGVVGAPEASSRAGDSFNVMEVDHVQICRPMTKTNRSFYGLTDLLNSIAEDVEAEKAQAITESRLQNLQYLPEQILGLDVPIQAVKTQLVASTTLGLVGMGGCGKTTLAKAIFNDLVMEFEYSSFVLEVKLISGSQVDVKKEVWNQMHHFGVEMATKPQWSLLKEKRLLLVLDDVSSDRDLDALFDITRHLAPGSRYIVTSRDRDLLQRLDASHEVPFLNDSVAKDLFVRHAFPRQRAPPSQLDGLVNAIVRKCDGLPLTLEVLGKYLHKRDEEEDWIQTLDALEKAEAVTGLNEKLWEKLKLSFDGLQENEQEIFLDIATFFCRDDAFTLGDARIAWEAVYPRASVRLLWRTLVDRSLVYDVQEDQEIQMHEQLLSLGRKIGANKNRHIWDSTDAMNLLQSTTEAHDKNVYALKLDLRELITDMRIAKTFPIESLREVRYLEVKHKFLSDEEDEVIPFLTNAVVVKFVGFRRSFARVLDDSSQLTRLVILCLSRQYLANSVGHLSALKVLKLDNCRNWFLPADIGHLQQLQVVHISYCDTLYTLPQSFGNLSALNRLVLSHCEDLSTLGESFGNLSALSTIWFHHCDSLWTLPESFGRLSALKSLQFDHCPVLKTLPDSFGYLSSLHNLQFKYCTELQTLPESFGKLSSLHNLQFKYCTELQTLPESFGKLSALSSLRFEYCPVLRTLPDSFGNLPALSILRVLRCMELHTLPESFGHLSALSNLEFKYCQMLQTFPESFGKLSALRSFEVRCYSLRALPDSFGNLSALSVLQIQDCGTLRTLPESFGQLLALSNLQFKNCHRLQTLPKSFGNLLALSNLQFENCSALQTFPESFGQLSSLQQLQLESKHGSAFSALPSSFGQLTKLKDLKISGCLKLGILPDSFVDLIALRQLSIERVGLKTVPDCIRSLRSLQVLELGFLPFAKKVPLVLGEAKAGLQITSIKIFNVRGGKFSLVTERNLTDDVQKSLMEELQTLTLERVA